MIIENGSDLLLVLNLTDEKGNRIRVSSKSSFTIRVFTADSKQYLEYGKEDIITTNEYDKLYLNSNELLVLESGVIGYTYMWGVTDKNFNDGEYNNQKTVYTDYYFKNSGASGGTVNPVDYKVIQQIKKTIKEETDRATAVEDSLFNKMENHQTEVTNRINQEADNTTTKVNTEATERKDADTALLGNIDKLSQTVTANKTASDKAISDVSAAVKSETARATAKESSLEGSINTTKSNLDAEIKRAKAAEKANVDAITTLSGTVSSNKTATDKAISDEVTRAKAAEAKALEDAKSDAASKYQPKGNYLTSHQNISGKLDKTTASQTYLTKTDASKTYQPKGNYLTSHLDISGKVDKVTGKGLSTNDYTTAEKNKLASLPDDFEGACTDTEIEAMFKELGI